MFISKMKLSRRTVLRGMGATLTLPLLEAMVPALTAAPTPLSHADTVVACPSRGSHSSLTTVR